MTGAPPAVPMVSSMRLAIPSQRVCANAMVPRASVLTAKATISVSRKPHESAKKPMKNVITDSASE